MGMIEDWSASWGNDVSKKDSPSLALASTPSLPSILDLGLVLEKVRQKRPCDPNGRSENQGSKSSKRTPRKKLMFDEFTTLNTSRSNIMMEIKDTKDLKWHPLIRSKPNKYDQKLVL
ncbi:Uncharacterized protein Fot_01899 [Forsythia ovata]|uniref:Uncharacterized protein n=1 Tax=Forsythia ovata TaxID=205694 RepID=A0ABD1X5A9_9LAMI